MYDSLKQVFNILHYKKMVPVVFLSCATLIGCSDGNTQSELPKQTKQTNQIKQEITGNDSFVKLEKNLMLNSVFMYWTLIRIKPLLINQMNGLHTHLPTKL